MLTYTTKVQVTTTKVVKPSEIYATPKSYGNIKQLLGTAWKIVDFRPPRIGDRFIEAGSGIKISTADVDFVMIIRDGPRFIVEPIPSAAAQVAAAWE